jgi:AcrR family transcriptional regulator
MIIRIIIMEMELQRLISLPQDDIDLPGVSPSRQKRSRETTLALLRAGAEMLRSRSLAELSIEALCAQVGATVGAFYSRFDSKEAYFNALLALAARDGDARLSELAETGGLESASLEKTSLEKTCRQIVGGIIRWMRDHEGVLRAALQHDDTRPDRWTTFKGLAQATVTRVTPPLLQAMGKGRRAAKTRSIAFGCQVVLGTLVNAILNDPGPLSIHDKEMEVRLSGCLLLLLEAEANAKPREPQRAKRRR